MKTITCDICGKEIKYYNFESVFKMKIKVPFLDIKDPKYQLCENCYGDMIKFMNGIRNKLERNAYDNTDMRGEDNRNEGKEDI